MHIRLEVVTELPWRLKLFVKHFREIVTAAATQPGQSEIGMLRLTIEPHEATAT